MQMKNAGEWEIIPAEGANRYCATIAMKLSGKRTVLGCNSGKSMDTEGASRRGESLRSKDRETRRMAANPYRRDKSLLQLNSNETLKEHIGIQRLKVYGTEGASRRGESLRS